VAEEPYDFDELNRKTAIAVAIHELAAGGELHAEWDAGGDNTLVGLYRYDASGERYDFDFAQSEALDVVRSALIDTLDLPNASEAHFHQGQAIVAVSDDGLPVAQVTSCDRDPDNKYWFESYFNPAPRLQLSSGGSPLRRNLETADAADVIERTVIAQHAAESVLHRADVTLVGEMDRELRIRSDVIIDVQQGDDVELGDKTLDYYRDLITEVLTDCVDRFDADPTPVGIYVEAQLQPGTSARFMVITDGYRILRVFDDTHVGMSISKWRLEAAKRRSE